MRQRQRPASRRARTRSHVFGRFAYRRVAVVGHQDLIAWRKAQRSQHGVAPRCRVLDEDEIVRTRVHEGGKAGRRGAQRRRQLLAHEVGRMALHQPAPTFLLGEHRARRRTEGAVIKEGDRGIEQPFVSGNIRAQRSG
jgi:hypothetical protein